MVKDEINCNGQSLQGEINCNGPSLHAEMNCNESGCRVKLIVMD